MENPTTFIFWSHEIIKLWCIFILYIDFISKIIFLSCHFSSLDPNISLKQVQIKPHKYNIM